MRKRWKCILLVVVFVISLPLIYYGLSNLRFNQANKAYKQGDYIKALEHYQAAEAMLDIFDFVKHLPPLKYPYQRLVLNQAKVLFALGRHDAVLKKLEMSLKKAKYLDFSPELHFWAGNALFFKAISRQHTEDILEDLQLVMNEYKKGLELAPEDWDLKYNYELTKRVIAEKIEKGEEDQLIELLEEKRRMDQEKRTLPPEKAG